MTVLIADVESDGLLPDMTRLWTIQLGDAEGDDVQVYHDEPEIPGQPCAGPLSEAIRRLREADQYVFHSGIGFDRHAINRFYPGTIEDEKLIDTLPMARLLDPTERHHKLRDWGERLNVAKGDYEGDFQTFDEDLVRYARQDIVVTRALYRHLKAKLADWGESVDLEQRVARHLDMQERNGFALDIAAAEALYADLKAELLEAERELKDTFGPIERTSTFIPKVNSKKFGYVKGVPFTKRHMEPFNPGSRKQIGERLKLLGWKPKPGGYGANGLPTVDEKVLAELPYPEAKKLLRYFMLEKKIGQIAEGDKAWLKLVGPDGRVHGRVNPNGAATGRMSHFAPNMAQVDKDPRMRSCWGPRKGWKQVGCDAEGLELRMLGHYLAPYDGGAFVRALLDGDKKLGTDPHSKNAKAVNGVGYAIDRDGAKTLIYALIYGAGLGKLGATVKQNLKDQGLELPKTPNAEIGALVRRALAKSMPGIDKLIAAVKAKAKAQGWIKGLDGRKIKVRSEHSAFNFLLQGGGAIVMKRALVIFMENNVIRAEEYGVRWALCANVHDEVQIEAEPDIAEDLGIAFANCITAAGEHYKLRCPMAGAWAVGNNWSETH